MMDELYKALETIRKECIKHEVCPTYPFDWQLRNDKEDVPRLFK